MTPLVSLPDPDDEPTVDQDVDPHAPSPDAAKAGKKPRRLGLRSRNPFMPPPIATPAPASFDRDIPAGDTDERALRSSWDHTDDRAAAATTRLQICNVEKAQMDRVPELVAVERRLRDKLALLRSRRQTAQLEVDRLSGGGPDPDRGDHESRLLLARRRRQALGAARNLAQLKQREDEVAFQLARVAQCIDAIPHRLYEEVAIIVGHHDRDKELRAIERPELTGTWSPPESGTPGWGIDGFERRYGPLPIPSRDALSQRIAQLRQSCQREGQGRQDVEEPEEV